MFKGHKQSIDRGISETDLIDECQKLLAVVLEDEDFLEKFGSVRVLHKDTNWVDGWKDYFYPDFKTNVNSPSQRVQWLNLRKMLIAQVQKSIYYGILVSEEKDSEQLREELIKTSKFESIEELKQATAIQVIFSEISTILLRNLLLRCFNDPSDYFKGYVGLYTSMVELMNKVKSEKTTGPSALKVLFKHNALVVLGMRKKICNGELWFTDTDAGRGLFVADESELSDIFDI
jgi:hypothetical protein